MTVNGMKYDWARLLAAAAALIGVVLIVAGWAGVSNATITTEQLPYLASGAVGGLFALGVAATLWLSSDLRDEFHKLDDIYQWLQGDEAALVEDGRSMSIVDDDDASGVELAGVGRGRTARVVSGRPKYSAKS